MRTMLVEPPAGSSFQSGLGASSIPSTASLAPLLEEGDHEVTIVDSPALGYDTTDLKRRMKDFKPDLVGITAMTPSIHSVYEVAAAAKDLDPDCTVLVGGSHPTFAPKQTLRECPQIDLVAMGEGEKTLREVASLKNPENIKGIAYREDGDVAQNGLREPIQDLDSLPLPSYHLLPMGEHEFQGKRFATIMTSRGCPFNCTFCSSQAQRKVRREKSPERVLEQIELLTNEYGVREIEFVDDIFTLNKDRAMVICDMIIERERDISWFCMSRADTIDTPLAEEMKESGCHTIYLGIESGVQEILDRIKKGIDLEQIKKAVRAVKGAGLNSVGSFILGIPGETKKMAKRTIEFAKELDLTLAQFSLLVPYPGTKEYERAEEEGRLLTKDWSKYTGLQPVMEVPGVAKEELRSLLSKAYRSFYFRPSFLWRVIKSGNLWTYLRTLWGML